MSSESLGGPSRPDAPVAAGMGTAGERGAPSARVSELRAEIQRLREANRRLQAEGEGLERDKLIVALRAEIVALREHQEADHHEIETYRHGLHYLGRLEEVAAAVADLSRYEDFAETEACGLCGPDNPGPYLAARMRLYEAYESLERGEAAPSPASGASPASGGGGAPAEPDISADGGMRT